ncbi:MAG: hypothetical protein NZ610_00030, partial [Candidatus Bipolaricaulota bacterium]|nr:hypothetical protein [Candidatus Bipolaricaulota bacterium]
AHRLTGEGRYVARAERLWSELKNAWERAHELSVTELGDLAGAFNAVIRVLRLEEAKSEYARFFSFWGERLQIDDGEGSLGRAPVFVTKVAYDRERKLWSVLDGRFSAAGALYTASRLLWLSGSCGEGFSGPPAYGLPQSSWIKLASAQAQMSALSTPPATSPIASAQEPQELAELRSQLETLVKQVTELERRIGEYAERLQRVEQELAELRQRSPSTEELQRSQALLDDLKVRVERLERRASEFPWVWALLALLVIGAVGWLYLRVRRRELGEI